MLVHVGPCGMIVAMRWAFARRSWTIGLCAFAAGISAIDAFCTLTNWANFAHHGRDHGISVAIQSAFWLAAALYYRRNG